MMIFVRVFSLLFSPVVARARGCCLVSRAKFGWSFSSLLCLLRMYTREKRERIYRRDVSVPFFPTRKKKRTKLNRLLPFLIP